MKKLLTVMACLAFVGALQAQSVLTKGNPYATTVKTGNRPGAGDWGLYVGPSLAEVIDLMDCLGKNASTTPSTVEIIRALPLVNVKHYLSDNMELRCGIQWTKKGYRSSGTIIDTTILVTQKQTTSYFRLIPGFAYHFSPRNTMDVYTGVALPLGIDGFTDKYEETNFISNSYRKSLGVGLEAFIGLQAFVADLPVAIGLEYGLSGMFHTGERIKNEYFDANKNKQTCYTDLQGIETYKDDFKANSGSFGNDLRLTITYYFNNK
ncbi:MAG: hypothetical protein J5873_01520 [Bacteroidales bacterium]|nr:hypothetical protein [Bacteroidales bacterium]